MAAVFPLDTTKPWTFNGVTYEYDAAEDRWFVVSTTKTDAVDDSLEELTRSLDVTNTVIDQEIENRSNLLDAAASKNNQQDASILELDSRIDAIGSAVGVLQFKGRFKYAIERTAEACDAAYGRCLIEAENASDPTGARIECNRLYSECSSLVGLPYDEGTFTSKGTTNVIKDVDEFVLSGLDMDGQVLDWINLVEPDDYLEFVELNNEDAALYQCIEEPKVSSTERSIRVKFLKDTAKGDGEFNLQEEYEVRVIKANKGIDLIEADARYVLKPYVVYFEDTPDDITPVHESGNLRNGELWFDTSSLQMFVWNNNAWVGTAPPPSQDIVITEALADIDALKAKPDITSSTTAPANPKQGDLWFNPSTLKFAFYTSGAWINPDQS
jgi:hypothetical protein